MGDMPISATTLTVWQCISKALTIVHECRLRGFTDRNLSGTIIEALEIKQ